MTIGLELPGRVNVSTTGLLPKMDGTFYVTPGTDLTSLVGLDGIVNVDQEYNDALFPRARENQIFCFAIKIDGYGVIPPEDLVGEISFEDDLERGGQLTFSLRADNPLIGTELTWAGPPPGKKNIDVYAGYLTSSGVKWNIMGTGFIADSSDRTVGYEGDAIMTITALGPRFRYDCKKVTFVLEDGHTSYHGTAVREIAREAGIPNYGLPDRLSKLDDKFSKGIQIDNDAWLGPAEQVLDAIDGVAFWARDGDFTWQQRTLFSSQISDPAPIELTEQDLVAGAAVSLSAAGAINTRIRVTGEDIVSEECGLVTKVTIVEIEKSDTTIPYADYKTTSSAGAVVAATGSDTTGTLVVHRTTTIQELWCGLLIHERIMVEEWHNPIAWRYKIDTAGAIKANEYNPGVWFFSDTVVAKDDSAQAYQWDKARFVQTGQVDTYYDYSETQIGLDLLKPWRIDPDYPSGSPPRFINPNYAGGEWVASSGNIGVRAPAGALYRVRSFKSGYLFREQRLKTGPPATGEAWVDVAYINDTKILGGGAGVYGSVGEEYYGLEGDVLRTPATDRMDYSGFDDRFLEITDDGFITSETNETHASFLEPGDTYWYLDGRTSKLDHEGRSYDKTVIINGSSVSTDNIPAPQSEVTTSYAADEGTGLTTVESAIDFQTNKTTVTTTTADGYLPAAQMKGDAATNTTTQKYCHEVIVGKLEAAHEVCEGTYSNPYLTSDMAKWRGYLKLRQDSAVDVSFTLPANTYLGPGRAVRLRLRRFGINHKIHVHTAGFQRGEPGEAWLTPIKAKIYVI
jgi:hypothetical protein